MPDDISQKLGENRLEGALKNYIPPNLGRNKTKYFFIRNISQLLAKAAIIKHLDIPEETLELMKEQKASKEFPILYVGSHKSLFETFALPCMIYNNGGELPFIIMRSGLFGRDSAIEHALNQVGVISIDRNKSPSNILKTEKDYEYILSNKQSLMLFPEAMRTTTGQFNEFTPTIFNAVINASKEIGRPVPIIGSNIDYSYLYEVEKYARGIAASSKLGFKEVFMTLLEMGRIYVSLSKPIYANPDDDYRTLKADAEKACMNLVKIQPINILSEAMRRQEKDRPLDRKRLYKSIDEVIEELAPFQDRFRRVATWNPSKILTASRIPADADLNELYKYYAGNIQHYIDASKSADMPRTILLSNNYVKRGKIFYWIAKKFTGFVLKRTSNIHIDMPAETLEYLKSHNNVIYASLHRSLWETVAFPHVLNKYDLKLPYTVMGNNLVKGRIFVYPMQRLGVVVAYRVRGDAKDLKFMQKIKMKINDAAKAVFEYTAEQLGVVLPYKSAVNSKKDAAYRMTSDVCGILAGCNPVMVFPEGTRSKDGRVKPFKTTAFQAAIYAGATIIPMEADYTIINEEKRYLKETSPYTFKWWHILEWFRNIGDVYVNFGKPIMPHGDRTELANEVRQECMNLVKIMPKNVVSYASFMDGDLKENVSKVMNALKDQSNKFIGWSLDDSVDDMISRANLTRKRIDIYKPYAGHISHYLEGKL